MAGLAGRARRVRVEGFDPENPSADDLPAAGDDLAKASAAGETALTSLQELDPADEARIDLDDLVAALEAQLESASRQTRAALDSDVPGFTATLDEAGPATEAVDDAAEARVLPLAGHFLWPESSAFLPLVRSFLDRT